MAFMYQLSYIPENLQITILNKKNKSQLPKSWWLQF